MADSVDIADLNIKLRSNGEDAAKGIRALADAFKTLSGTGLSTIQKDLGGIATQMTRIVDASGRAAKASATQAAAQKSAITSVVTAQQTASKQTTTAVNTAANNQTKASDKVAKAQESSSKRQWAAISSVANSLGSASTSALSGITRALSPVANGFKNLFSNIITGSNKSHMSLFEMRATLFTLAFVVGVVGTAFKSLFDKASESFELLHLFKAAYSDNTEASNAYADSIYNVYKNMASLLGVDLMPMTQTAATFKLMTNAMGIATDASDKMSQGLTELVYDYASLTDKPFSYVSNKFQSALAGQTRAIREFGLDITQASLQQELYDEGLSYSVTDLTRAQKAILIYNTLIRHSTDAQGDLAASITQPANMLRILKEQATIAARAFGYLFIPAIQAILPWLIYLTNALGNLFQMLGGLVGIQMPDLSSVAAGGAGLSDTVDDLEDESDAVGDVGDSAGDTASQLKKLQDYTTGLDELNILRPDDTTDSGTDSGSSGTGTTGTGGDITPLDPYSMFPEGFDALKLITQPIQGALDVLNKDFAVFREGMKYLIGSIADDFSKIFATDLPEHTLEALNSLLKGILDSIGLIATAFANAWNNNATGYEILTNIFKLMINVFSIAGEIAAEIGKWAVSDAGQAVFNAVVDTMLEIVKDANSVAESLRAIWDTGGRVSFNNLLTALGQVLIGFFQIIDTAVIVGKAIMEGFFRKDFFGFSPFDHLTQVISNLGGLVQDVAAHVKEFFSSAQGEGVINTFMKIARYADIISAELRLWWNNGGSAMFDKIVGIGAQVVDVFGQIALLVVTIATNPITTSVVNGLLDFISMILSNPALPGLVVAIAGGIVTLAGGFKIINGLSSAFSVVKTFLSVIGISALPASTGMEAMGTAAASAGPGLIEFGAGIALIGVGVGLIIGSLALLVFSVAALVDAFSAFTSMLVDKVMPNWDQFKVMLTEGISILANGLLALSVPVLTFLGSLAVGIALVSASLVIFAASIVAVGVAGILAAPGLLVITAAALGIATAVKIASDALINLGMDFNDIKDIASWAAQVIGAAWANIQGFAAGVIEGAANAFRDGANFFIGIFNSLIRTINSAVDVINQIPTVHIGWYLNEVSYLATGGMPGEGQMFIAGEAGPELVGSYGGNKNTVMPLENSGFVEAMAGSVYAAVVSAMQDADKSGTGNVYLNGKLVGQVLDRQDAATPGMTLVSQKGIV